MLVSMCWLCQSEYSELFLPLLGDFSKLRGLKLNVTYEVALGFQLNPERNLKQLIYKNKTKTLFFPYLDTLREVPLFIRPISLNPSKADGASSDDDFHKSVWLFDLNQREWGSNTKKEKMKF